MKQIHWIISPELLAAIDSARGDAPRLGWVEKQLWKLKIVRDGAIKAGVSNPGRPLDGRGKWQR